MSRKTIFDLVNDVTANKVGWEDQTTDTKRQMNQYMMNRILSMDIDLVDFVNTIQTHNLDAEMTYNVYLSLLPKRKKFNKYIKNTTDENPLVDFFVDKLQMRSDEVEQIIKYSGKSEIKNELIRYGLTEKEIKKQFKI
jgi:hypothetical protein